AAAAEMRDDAAPPERLQALRQRARIMRGRVALEPVKKHDSRRAGRCARAILPVEVHEIAVRRVDALAAKDDLRRPEQCRIDRLRMPAGKPARRRVVEARHSSAASMRCTTVLSTLMRA